ncbi:hypothetical protein HGRIS_000138 [Hohenbuehelia grisea]|uniref:NAD(P)-binding protein n=1 Tax=Hohenbuehelia grisea TaxID=104357 RepID=A0ABR3JS39_9AGAR
MPSWNDILEINKSFAPKYDSPVAIFLGGTSGVGRAMAEAFARYTGGKAHIVIIGRNRRAAQASIDTFPKPTSGTFTHEFVECDVSLMKNVREVTSVLVKRLPKVNFLVMSTGVFVLTGRNETVEGIDEKMALNYYARWKFTHDLLPLLRKAADAGEDARVFSLMGAGGGKPVDMGDLGLKRTHTVMGCVSTLATYNDMMMEKFSLLAPSVSFTHGFPGPVRSPMMTPTSWLFKPIFYALYPLVCLVTVAPETSAEYQLSALLSAGKGFNSTGARGERLPPTSSKPEDLQKLWEHTVQCTGT